MVWPNVVPGDRPDPTSLGLQNEAPERKKKIKITYGKKSLKLSLPRCHY